MILADKIAELRKKNGWSQEELAGQLGVSRQSVSKWESAASIPDLDKILKLSELFGVSTDYLLKDSGEPEEEALPAVMPAGESMLGTEGSVRAVSLEEANEFLDTVWSMRFLSVSPPFHFPCPMLYCICPFGTFPPVFQAL